MKERILLIDTSTLLYAAKFSLGKSKLSANKIKTGIIFGFLLKLQLITSIVKPTLIVFAIDSKQSKRKEIYPDYKGNRKNDKTPEEKAFDDECYKQFNIITYTILKDLGYRNLLHVGGLEADDIIASICKKYIDNEIIIASTDEDMYQLLTDNVCMFKTSKNKYYTKSDFIREFDIEPKIWKRIKSWSGCSSDKVAGVKGVGVKTAIKYYKNELKPHLKTYIALKSKEGKEIINRNKKLVILPFKGTPKFNLKPNRVTPHKVLKVAKEYNIKSIERDVENWYYKLR